MNEMLSTQNTATHRLKTTDNSIELKRLTASMETMRTSVLQA